MNIEKEPGTATKARSAFLLANSQAYEWLIRKIGAIDRRNKMEVVLHHVRMAARFAAEFHPGRFADGAIENIALEIGAELDGIAAQDGGLGLPVAREGSRRRVLHVASSVLGIGGLTRMLYHWIRNDQTSCHSIVVVNQPGVIPVPRWLSEAVQNRGGHLVLFPPGSNLCQKAQWLRKMARQGADLVVLHHGAFDVVPTVAFSVNGCPPVVVLNHADHLFWLGSSVSDMVINLRTAGAEHTAKRRFVSSNAVLPVPLVDPVRKASPRQSARCTLGIPEDQIMLLSIGRAEKYRPCGPYDFVATAGKILQGHPRAHLYVVGESFRGIAPYLRCGAHERLHFVGSMEDPSLYRAAADVYLESFPFGSQTALLEAALSGLPVVPAYAPLFPLLVANDDAILKLLPNPHCEQEFLERVNLLIQEPGQRLQLGEALRKCLLVDHVGQGWVERLIAMYRETAHLTHIPQPIPASPCCMTDADISLSLWHVVADGKTHSAGLPKDPARAVLRHTAYVAKDVGDYATARWCAWRALRYDPHRWAPWRLLIVTVLGRAGRLFRQVLRRTQRRIRHQRET